MKKLVAILVLSLLFGNVLQAQVVTGLVKDAKTNQPLPFVNVGIVGKNAGTVTNDTGGFKLNIANHSADTLRISMIGYKPASFLIADVVKEHANFTVSLIPDVVALKEIKVSNRKWRTAILGNTTKSQSMTANFSDNVLGHEIGAIIKIKRSPTWLKRFNASIVSNMLTDSVMLRLNIYTVKDGLPSINILQHNIITTVRKGDKAVDIDLEPYNVMVEDRFFVSLEWIQSSPGRGLQFSASFLSSAIIARQTSQAAWEKVGIAGVGFNVLAEF